MILLPFSVLLQGKIESGILKKKLPIPIAVNDEFELPHRIPYKTQRANLSGYC